MIAANNKSNAKIAAKNSTSNLSRFIIQSSCLHFPALPEFARGKLRIVGGFRHRFGFFQNPAARFFNLSNALGGFEAEMRTAKACGAAFVMPNGDARERAALRIVFRAGYQSFCQLGEFTFPLGLRGVRRSFIG